ncbi:MAG: ABC transporter permease, partial [Ignavibacteriaceae bacterium]
LLLSELALPYFNQLSGKELFLNYSASWFIISGILIILFTGLFSGIYPALFLSGFLPSKFINNSVQTSTLNNQNKKSSVFRNILVAGQFALAIIAIVCTLVVSNQMNFIRNTNLGFDKENVIYLRMGINYNPGAYESLKTELKKLPEVTNASYSNSVPTTTDYYPRINWMQNGEQKTGGFTTYEVDADYLKTMHIQLKEGRFFNKDIASDKENAVVLNEAAVKALGFKKPLEGEIEIGNRKAKIIGVIKDFHFETFRDEIKPLFFIYEPNSLLLNIRISSAGFQSTIKKIKSILNQQMPGLPFEWHFLDKQIEQLYQADQRMMKVFSICSLLAIFTSCLGLFGLVSFFVQRKTKEIGIRKILGASVPGVIFLLTKELTKWVLIANIIAWPVAYYVMQNWLQDFAYRIELSWWMFLAAGGIALIIALATVGFQAIKAATANPIESLRYE